MPALLSVDKSLSQARQAIKKQDWLGAVQLYKSVLERFPANKKAAKSLADIRADATKALLNDAQAAQANEDWRRAYACLDAAYFLAPHIPAIRNALVECSLEAKKPKRAEVLSAKVLQSDPDDVRNIVYYAKAKHELNQAELARQSLQRALDLSPNDVPAHSAIALVERSQGNLPEAQKHFETGLQLSPWDVGLIRNLAALKADFSADDPVIAQAKQAIAKLGANNPRTAFLHFALFDMLDKADARDEAFQHLISGNKLFAANHPFDFKSEALVGGLSKVLFPSALPPVSSDVKTKLIFVTGLPRTGTTLTERILARAEGVQPAGELNIVSSAVLDMLKSFPERSKKVITDKDIKIIRERVIEEFDQLSDGRPVIVDKMPLNFRWIGFICAALPEARIIHMNRDPRAVAWSLYRHVFQGRGHDFIYTPQDIAKFMVFHRDLMRHWHSVCGHRIHELNYSDLVEDQKTATQALAKAVDLEWTEDWLTPEKATNHVRTSSVVQVTKPIYSGSDMGWRRYEAKLAPLMAALQAAKLLD